MKAALLAAKESLATLYLEIEAGVPESLLKDPAFVHGLAAVRAHADLLRERIEKEKKPRDV